MRFAYPEIETVFQWPQVTVPVLVIENQRLFRRLVSDIHHAMEGREIPVVVSVDDRTVSVEKHVELIADFLSFELNRKSLVNKICAVLEQTAVSAEHYEKTQELMSLIEARLDDWTFDFPCDIIASKITVASLLKAVGISVREEYEGDKGEVEKLLDYMELVREFERDKLFVTINMRSWFDDDVIAEFMTTVLSHGYMAFMIESTAHPMLGTENRVTIDRDLCEF